MRRDAENALHFALGMVFAAVVGIIASALINTFGTPRSEKDWADMCRDKCSAADMRIRSFGGGWDCDCEP